MDSEFVTARRFYLGIRVNPKPKFPIWLVDDERWHPAGNLIENGLSITFSDYSVAAGRPYGECRITLIHDEVVAGPNVR
jgi:hypothetical protein